MSGSTEMYYGVHMHERKKVEPKRRKTKKLVRKLLRGGIGNEYSVKPQTVIRVDKKSEGHSD